MFGGQRREQPLGEITPALGRIAEAGAAILDDNKGGRFTQGFKVFVEGWAPLPGDLKRWPQSVRVDGAAAVVAPKDERPSVLLNPWE